MLKLKLNVDYVLVIRPNPDRTCYNNHIEFLRFLKEPDDLAIINNENIIEDLKKRTGLNIHRISIMKIDFVKNTAQIKVYYYEI